jgi:hypothetical protein
MDASLYVDRDSVERFTLAVAAVRRMDLEELAILQTPDPGYGLQLKAFNELAVATGYALGRGIITYLQARLADGELQDSLSNLRAFTTAWQEFCLDLKLQPVHTCPPEYAELLAILREHPPVAMDRRVYDFALGKLRQQWQLLTQVEPQGSQTHG